MDDNFCEIFHRLDLTYGRPEKLSDAVLCELKSLKVIRDGDSLGLIKMIEIVENCWLDLKKIKLESEMNTSTMVSQIEKLLPGVQNKEWIIMKQRLKASEHKDIFRTFLDFLLRENYALKYMQSDIRNDDSGIQRGKAHSALVEPESTHNIKAKLDQQQEMLQQVVQGLAQVAEPVSSKNASREWNNEKQRRNDPPKWKCWYHSVDSHDIGKCTGLSHLDHGEKKDLLRKNRKCFSCLKQGHLSGNCVDRKQCEIQGCQCTLHPTLHSASRTGASLHSNTWIANGENIRGSERTLLMVSSVDSKQGKLTTLWEPGANMSLITHRAARRLGLVGKEVTLTLTKVGNSWEL